MPFFCGDRHNTQAWKKPQTSLDLAIRRVKEDLRQGIRDRNLKK
jgi:hypothetical protein